MRTKGRITSWNDGKGFGFISPIADEKKVFVHISAFSNPNRRPEINQLVTYALSEDKHGRPCAVQATLAGDRLPEKARRNNGSLSVAGAAAFIVVVGVSAITNQNTACDSRPLYPG